MINAFRGRWAKLTNYSICTVFYHGKAYMSSEHAYQAHRFSDPFLQKQVRNAPTPNAARSLAHDYVRFQRNDWDDVKVDVMHEILREKFAQEPERSTLLSTGDQLLVEGNWWHDNFWGDCTCNVKPECRDRGSNWLGRLLMDVRAELIRGYVPDSEMM